MQLLIEFDAEDLFLDDREQKMLRLIEQTKCKAFGTVFSARVNFIWEKYAVDERRLWFQLTYATEGDQWWRGRKWYLSRHMTDDEIVKTIWLAFEIAVRHELLEGFTFGGKLVFNPHTPVDVLIKASEFERFRA
jgi:hypothetical protein